MALPPSRETPVWLVTGCSTGFGRHMARALVDRGYRVAATARDPETVGDMVAANAETALALKLDVTSPADVQGAVAETRRAFGRIDVLVNNAGYGYLAAIEEGEDSDIRAMFDTNVLGLAAMTRAVLPVMRAQKSGAIVNISSIGGFIGFPGSGYYAATKFAVEGLSESLAKEVAPFGIRVLIVEPGPFRTDWAGRSLKTAKRPIDAYAETAIARRRQIQGYSGNQPGDPVRAAEAIIAAVESPRTPLRLPLGAFAYEAMGAELESLRREHQGLEAVARGADYPA
ncbi:MAG TPA: oxidoreductase [Roseiarcus sp.]|jgi:NAD(P)-dependent dehydrogenase (short-subunit alcohol dehydrogenase family)|nr:oxidoreductase [Roseiarcus sp.]